MGGTGGAVVGLGRIGRVLWRSSSSRYLSPSLAPFLLPLEVYLKSFSYIKMQQGLCTHCHHINATGQLYAHQVLDFSREHLRAALTNIKMKDMPMEGSHTKVGASKWPETGAGAWDLLAHGQEKANTVMAGRLPKQDVKGTSLLH